jgi:3-deoxy-D-arabino-heptulosonate 7-phosphate (DAHP) synthase
LFRSPVTARKTAANISLKEGGVSELKIVLNVSNRSNNKLRNIEVIDRIPNIADLEKGLTIGTLHPTKILKHERKGTIIKWVIDNLDAGDERVISYKIKSHLSILGEFSLTPTIVKFNFKGKEIITHSNSLGISP